MRRGRSSRSLPPTPDSDPERLLRTRRRELLEIQGQSMANPEQHIAKLQQMVANMTAQLQILTQREIDRQAADQRRNLVGAEQAPQPTTLGEYMMPTRRGPISSVVFPQGLLNTLN